MPTTAAPSQQGPAFFYADFEKLKLRYPVCVKFCPESDESETCLCKREREYHTNRVETRKGTWSKETNTDYVKSENGLLKTGAPFVHIDIETPPEKVSSLLLDLWKIEEPKLIMSIIGGAKLFKVTDRIETSLLKGIMDIATESGAWIITNGYKTGVVQLIGQTIDKIRLRKSNHNVTAIGISKWGSIKHVEELTGLKKEAKNTKHMTTTINTRDDESQKLRSGESYLEMHHSHYLMLDDGKARSYDAADFRTRLCCQIARQLGKDLQRTPVLTVVVEGGPDTLANIYYDLKNSIPVVIIDGSGRIADYLSRWKPLTKNLEDNIEDAREVYGIDELTTRDMTEIVPYNKKEAKTRQRVDIYAELHIDSSVKKLRQLFAKYQVEMKTDLRNTLFPDQGAKKKKDQNTDSKAADKNEKRLALALDQVMFCLQPSVRSLVTVFNADADTSLSETIFESICHANRKFLEAKHKSSGEKTKNVDLTPLLDLAMNWKCINVAKKFVFQDSLDNIKKNEESFIQALRQNLPQFVNEFLKLGLDPAEVFFGTGFTTSTKRYKEFLEKLYTEDAVNQESTHLKHFVQNQENHHVKRITNVDALNAVLAEVVGDYMFDLYFDSEDEEMQHRKKWGLLIEDTIASRNGIQDAESRITLSTLQKGKARRYIIRDLFIWAILMNYVDMAKVFMCYLKYRICPALLATKILKAYHEKAVYGELKDEYKQSIDYFEKYAIDCLEECSSRDADRACQVVVQQNEIYGYITCIQVAANADDKSFIATPSCVQAMNNIWYDKIDPEQKGLKYQLGIVLALLSFGLLAPVFLEYREDGQIAEHGESPKPILRNNGITYCDPYPLEYPRWLPVGPTANRYLHRFVNFHRSLMVKFCYHVMTYIFFVLLFSYVLLFKFEPPTDATPPIDWTEILTIIFVSCMLIEEIHFVFTQDNLKFGGQISNCYKDLFKPLMTIAFILFYIGLILRFTYADNSDHFVAARVVMAFDIELWWLRCLSFIIVIPFLGPHLVAIAKMLKDLSFFLLIIAVVMISYGVASRAIVYYPSVNGFSIESGGSMDTSFDARAVFRNVLYRVYFLIYGEFDDQLTDLDKNPDAGWSISTHILLAIHMILVNILLVNLLIAMFSKRFDEVYSDTQKIWYSQQYLFTREYFARTPIVPPLGIVHDIYYLLRMFIFFIARRVFKKSAYAHAKRFKMIAIEKSLLEEWLDFEGAATYKYAQNEAKKFKDGTKRLLVRDDSNSEGTKEEKVEKKYETSGEVMSNVKEVQDTVSRLQATINEMKLGFKTHLHKHAGADTYTSSH